ncbi:MAG: stage II sporulation protein E [Clostridiales bacterium]|jgi:stage II sporulation protein E|nr:stage II sporulation protein E [Clostridiales bacterium]
MEINKRKNESLINFKINRRAATEIFLVLGSFAAARALIFDAAAPFALAYIAPFLFRTNKFYAAAFLAAAGVFSAFRQEFSMKYLLALVILTAANLLVSLRPKTGREAASFVQAAAVGGAAVLAGFVLIFVRGQGIFEVLLNILEGGLIFALAIVLAKGMACITPAAKRGALGNEELMAVLVLASVLTIGISDIHIWLFSLRHVAAVLIVLLAAQSGGAAIGAVCGMMLGLLLNITGFEYIFFAVLLGIAGFAAGAARPAGRALSLAAFALAALFAALYFDLGLISWPAALSLALAGAIFLLLPKSFLLNIHINVNPALDSQEEYLEKVREQVLKRIYDIAGGYGKLAKTFEARIAAKSPTETCAEGLAKSVQEGLCRHCHKFTTCWDERAEDTRGFVAEIAAKGEKRGKLYMEDSPLGFSAMCMQVPEFMGYLGAELEFARMAKEWQQKVVETKSTIHQQFAGLSNVMYEFAVEISAILNFQKELEDRILREFAKEKVEVENLIVIENTLGKYEINLARRGRRGETKFAKHIGEVISRAVGRQMELLEERFAGRVVRLSYHEKQKFYIHSGIAKVNKELASESGDSFSLIQLRDGRCVAALSDGMGSGAKAREGSEAAIELLEELMEKGFKKDIAIKLINSALLLKSHDEFFSTLDICLIDLNSGLAEFIKIGASASYLLRHGEVEALGSWTLPVGILESVEIDTCERQLSHGDIIVMTTDGVADSVKDGEDDWLRELLARMNLRNPQDIADHILEEGKRNYGRHIGDDMTVLVLRILDRK